MIYKDKIPKNLISIVEERFKGLENEITFPPPVFDIMEGEMLPVYIYYGYILFVLVNTG